MSAYKRVDAADLAFFEGVAPGRVCSGADISADYDHD